MKRTIILMLIILAAIGISTRWRFIERLFYAPWFIPVCLAMLIVLVILFVLVSCSKEFKERKLEVNARQLFAEYIPRFDPEEQDLHIILSISGGRPLNESEVFTPNPRKMKLK